MTVRDKLDELRREIPTHLIPLLDQVVNYAHKTPYDHAAYVLVQELEGMEEGEGSEPGLILDHCAELLDEIEWGLDRYFKPMATQGNAYKRDKETYFLLMRRLIEKENVEGLRENAAFFFEMFAPGGKQLCGHLRFRCFYADVRKWGDTDLHCMHRFKKDEHDVVICPECGTPRYLCRNSPKANGYCHFHGGKAAAISEGAITGLRAESVYGKVLGGRALEHFNQLKEDPEFLSVVPEITLTRTRIAENLGKLQEFDPEVVRSGIERAVRQGRKELDKDTPNIEAAHRALSEIDTWLYQGTQEGRARAEIMSDINTLRGLATTERKRMVEAQQMIPRQEAALVADELVREFSALIETFRDKTWEQYKQYLYKHFPGDSSRIINHMSQGDLKHLMHDMMLQEMSDALLRAEQEQFRQQVIEENVALIEGEMIDEYESEEMEEAYED